MPFSCILSHATKYEILYRQIMARVGSLPNRRITSCFSIQYLSIGNARCQQHAMYIVGRSRVLTGTAETVGRSSADTDRRRQMRPSLADIVSRLDINMHIFSLRPAAVLQISILLQRHGICLHDIRSSSVYKHP
jgi:hypothetical protein